MTINMIQLSRNESEGINQHPNSLFRRKDQLTRWLESETNKSLSINKKPSRVKFDKGTSFLAACSSGDLEEVKRLLSDNVDINTCNVDGLTALHQACIDNDLDLVKFLISHKADIDVRDNEGWTPLHATASCAYMEVAKCLLDNGADVAAVNNDGDLAIDLAENLAMENLLDTEMQARQVNADCARNAEEAIMEKDASRWLVNGRYENVRDPKTDASPLHVAAAKGYLRCLNLLLSCPGVEPNCRDADGWTPLHAAAHWGQSACCEALVEASGCLDAKTDANQTVMELAEPELLPLLTKMRQKQVALKICQQQEEPINCPPTISRRNELSSASDVSLRHHTTEMKSSLQRPSGPRSSVTRISGDQKHTKVAQSLEEERQVLQHAHIQCSDGDLPEDVLSSSTEVKTVEATKEKTMHSLNKLNNEYGNGDSNVERRQVPGRSGTSSDLRIPLSAPPGKEFLPQRRTIDAKVNGDERNLAEQDEKKLTKSYHEFKQEYGSRRKIGGTGITATTATTSIKSTAAVSMTPTSLYSSRSERLFGRDSANSTSSSTVAPSTQITPALNSGSTSDNQSVQQTSTALGPSFWRANLRRTGSLQAGSNTDNSSNFFSSKHSVIKQDSNSSINSIPSTTLNRVSSTTSSLVQSNSQKQDSREELRPTLKNKEVSDVTNFRRISTIMEPSKTGEAETQRKTAARRARQSRRSTQGVTEDELKEAQLLLHTHTTGGSALEASSSLPSISNTHLASADDVQTRLGRRQTKDPFESTAPEISKSNEDFKSQSSTSCSSASQSTATPLCASESRAQRTDDTDQSSGVEPEPNWKRIRRERTELLIQRTASDPANTASKELEQGKSSTISEQDDDDGRISSSLSRSASEKTSRVTVGKYDASNSNLRSLIRSSLNEESTDWKKLYEKEKEENIRLCRELELKRSESEERHKSCEKLLAENGKLREENGSLIRVISKLSQQSSK